MYCPRCSQQQASEEVRFCSRCGFQLGVVKELLAQTEAPAPAAVEPLQPARGLRKRDVTVGALLMFVVALVVVLFPDDTTPPPVRDGHMVALVGLFIVLTLFINFIGPLLRAVNRLFGEDEASQRRGQLSQPQPDLSTKVSASARDRAALPPARSAPAASFNSPRADTAEMVRPPSITEQTTNLLNNK